MAVSGSAVCVAVIYVVSLIMNGLAGSGVLGKSIGQVSDENPTFVMPDGRSFAVWGLIYTLLTVLVAAQFCPSEDVDALLAQKSAVADLDVRQRLMIAFLLNAMWLPFFVFEFFWTCLVIIVLYLISLVSVYMNLSTKKTRSFFEWLAYAAPIATNASWVTVATFLNIFVCLRAVGWQAQYGIGGSVPAAMAVVVLVALLASWLALINWSVMWSSVAAWALFGIYRTQTIEDPEAFPVNAMNSTLAYTALTCGIVSIGATVVALFMIACGQSSKKDEVLAPAD